MKSSKLRFKNTDPSSTSSKKKSHKRKQNHLQSSTHSNDSDNKGNSVRSAWQITHQTPNGPTLLLSSQTNQPSCLFAHPESTKISFREQQIVIDNFEPTEVEQVFFVSILPGSKIKYSLKSFNDKYLGCDAFGVCSCTREAIGLQEEFEIEQVEGNSIYNNHFIFIHSFCIACYTTPTLKSCYFHSLITIPIDYSIVKSIRFKHIISITILSLDCL